MHTVCSAPTLNVLWNGILLKFRKNEISKEKKKLVSSLSILVGKVRLGQVLGQVRLCQVRIGQFRLVQVSLGQFRLVQVSLGQFRLVQVRLGKVRLGQVRFSQVRLGQVRLGQVRLGQDSLGQVSLGQDRLGQDNNKQINLNLHFFQVGSSHRCTQFENLWGGSMRFLPNFESEGIQGLLKFFWEGTPFWCYTAFLLTNFAKILE